MSYQVLYRTYRPTRFDEVVGQEYIVKTLKNAIKVNKIAHAYLFAGPRGTGKTTIAKLFAKAINCENFKDEPCGECPSCLAYKENHPDIIELDAASNNSVDNIREIVEQVNYAPMVGRYKVYIIDEVHMLSGSAFNALLKTLEEPPAHVVFILATTDPQKVIPTVLSRCQRYNFSKISNFNMKKKMIEILKKENIKYEEAALDEVAILAEGGMRDALSILEQILSYNNEEIKLEDVQKIFGLSSTEEKVNLLIDIHTSSVTSVINKVREMYQEGVDPKRLSIDLLEIIKEALIYSDNAEEKLLTKLPKLSAIRILEVVDQKTLLNDIKCLEDVIVRTKGNQNYLSFLELALIQMSSLKTSVVTAPVKEVVTPKDEEIKIEEPKVVEVKEEVKPIEQETVVEEIKEETPQEIKVIDLNYIAHLLLSASKDEKINDAIIYNRLEIYKFEADKRKYYELLNNTELFASCKDAIIICANKTKVNNINSPEVNADLYKFLLNDYGIDKVIYAIESTDKEELIALYRKLREEKKEAPVVEKPKIEKEPTNEEKLKELFADVVRVEE